MSLPSNLGTIEAPFFIGMMASCALFGITCAQVVYYYRNYPSDHPIRKSLVAFLFLLELAHLTLIGEASHFLFVICKLPENAQSIFFVRSTFSVSYILTVLITSTVQGFYAWRVWTVSKSHSWGKPVVGVIVAATIVQFGLGIVEDAFLFINPALPSIHARRAQGIYSSQLAVAMACDVMISVALVRFLNLSRSGFHSTENIIDRLIVYSVNIGLVTSAISVVTFATFLALPDSTLFTAFTEIISKVYVNSLLVTLNSRKNLRKTFDSRAAEAIPLSGSTYAYASQGKLKSSQVTTGATLFSNTSVDMKDGGKV